MARIEGQDNLLWRVRHDRGMAAVKLFLDAGQARGRRQFDGHERFAPAGIAPKPLWFDRYPHGLSRQALVYEWQDGAELSAGAVHALTPIASVIAQVHGSPVEDVRRFCPHPFDLTTYWTIERDALRQAARVTATGATRLSQLAQALAGAGAALVEKVAPLWTQARPAPVHGDLTPENILIRDGETASLIDWEYFGIGDPALDVARLVHRVQAGTGGDVGQILLDAYLAHVADMTLPERIDCYVRLLSLRALAYLINGAHEQLLHTEASLSEVLPFLRETVAATLKRALHDFEPAGAVHDPDIAACEWQEWIQDSLHTVTR